MLASSYGYKKVISYLLKLGADPDICDHVSTVFYVFAVVSIDSQYNRRVTLLYTLPVRIHDLMPRKFSCAMESTAT
jgi:hypothetical protein